MKSISITTALFVFGWFFLFQNAWSQEACNDPCSQPSLTQEQRDKYNAEANKELKKIKDKIERQYKQAVEKASSYEKEIIYLKGAITEKDQEFINFITEWALITPGIFTSESIATLYVKILLKGDHDSFRFFEKIDDEQERKAKLDYVIEAALSRIKSSDKSTTDLADEVVRRGKDFPRAAREAFKLYQ